MTLDPEPLLSYVRLRREAQARREAGGPPPWSNNAIIASRHFCCVIRDDDRTSRDAKVIIDGLSPQEAWPAAMTFRLYNRPSTLRALLSPCVLFAPVPEIEARLRALPVVFNTVAYRVTLKGGLWNLPTLAQTVYRAARLVRQGWRPRERAEHCVQQLQGELGIGPFLAYQVMQDLRWLRGPFDDEDEWCLVGGGAALGVDHLTKNYSTPKFTKVGHRVDHNVSRFLSKVELPRWKQLLEVLKIEEPRANMFELEHNLCEYRKWEGIRQGEVNGRRWSPHQ
jgi:hypothetical protein